MKPTTLDANAVRQHLADLPGWHYEEDEQAITRRLVFGDFAQAFAFLTRIALAAEQRDHHPELFNLYNRVDVTLTTHDAGGCTSKDIEFARWINSIASDD